MSVPKPGLLPPLQIYSLSLSCLLEKHRKGSAPLTVPMTGLQNSKDSAPGSNKTTSSMTKTYPPISSHLTELEIPHSVILQCMEGLQCGKVLFYFLELVNKVLVPLRFT